MRRGSPAHAPAPADRMSAGRTEDRIEAARERVQQSLRNSDPAAFQQDIDAAVVREVQSDLRRLNEYHGDISGILDSVTVNAIQAFQRSAGLDDTGIIDSRTRERLAAAATVAKQ